MGDGHLTVTGTLGRPAKVELIEQDIAGDYWEVLLLAFDLETGPEVVTPFTVQRLMHAREGKKGFELVGATKRERISLQPLSRGDPR